MRGLSLSGFHVPSPVQRAAIPLGRHGADLIVQAKSGTGKTATFGTVVCDRVDREVRRPQAVIIAPTREVATQSHAVIRALASTLPDPPLVARVCVGGLPVAADRTALGQGVHVVVGTPGRVRQLLEEGSLRPDGVRIFVIDEADALMGGTFEADVLFIHSMLPDRKQVLAFSATYPPAMRRRLESMTRSPQSVAMCTEASTALRAVRQFYVLVGADRPTDNDDTGGHIMVAKEGALRRVFGTVAFHQAVVFVRRLAWGEALAKRLCQAGHRAVFTAGVLPQARRMEVMASMRACSSRVLVSTDLVARGVDLERVNLVVNMDVPQDAATYMHRVGRTGRFGTIGLSVTVVTPRELATLRELLAAAQGRAGVTLERLPNVVPADWYDDERDEDLAAADEIETPKEKGDAGLIVGEPATEPEPERVRGKGVEEIITLAHCGEAAEGDNDGTRVAETAVRAGAGLGPNAVAEAETSGSGSGAATWQSGRRKRDAKVRKAEPDPEREPPTGEVNSGREWRHNDKWAGCKGIMNDDDCDAIRMWRWRQEWASYWWWWWYDRHCEQRQRHEQQQQTHYCGWFDAAHHPSPSAAHHHHWLPGTNTEPEPAPWIVPPLHASLARGHG